MKKVSMTFFILFSLLLLFFIYDRFLPAGFSSEKETVTPDIKEEQTALPEQSLPISPEIEREDTSEDVPEDISEDIPENVPEDIPEEVFEAPTEIHPEINSAVEIRFIDKNETAAYILYDVSSESVLFSHNKDKKTAPASLTKLVTAAVALEYMDKDTVLEVGDEVEMILPYSSICYLRKGYRLTLSDAVTGMLMMSGNDGAYTIAVNVAKSIYGNVSDKEAVNYFCEMMNDFASRIGMKDSHFNSPDGYDTEGQYTTVGDLLKLALYIKEDDFIYKTVSIAKKSVTIESGQTLVWTNTNDLLDVTSSFYYPYASGMKTGTTPRAGYCLISTAAKDGKETVSVVVNSDTRDQLYFFTLNMLKAVMN